MQAAFALGLVVPDKQLAIAHKATALNGQADVNVSDASNPIYKHTS